MKLRNYIVTLLFTAATQIVSAQDFHYSLINTSPLWVNPAYTGIFEPDFVNKHIRLTGNFRQQWRSISSPFVSTPTPFNTGSFSIDGMIKHKQGLSNNFFGAGLLFINDMAGDLNFRSQHALGSIGFHHRLGHSGYHFLSLGLQAGMIIRSADFSNAYFDAQWTGVDFNPDLPPNEYFPTTHYNFGDISTGISFHNFSKTSINYTIGFSLYHFNKPRQAFYQTGKGGILKPRYTGHAVFELPHHKKYKLVSTFYYHQHTKTNVFYVSVFHKQHWKTTRKHTHGYQLGGGYHIVTDIESLAKQQALIIAGKLRYDALVIGGAYDFNISSLIVATNSLGAFELSLMYYLDLYKANKRPRKRTKNHKVKCPPGQKNYIPEKAEEWRH